MEADLMYRLKMLEHRVDRLKQLEEWVEGMARAGVRNPLEPVKPAVPNDTGWWWRVQPEKKDDWFPVRVVRSDSGLLPGLEWQMTSGRWFPVESDGQWRGRCR
uniref:Uncharacterized protein n=1 Tax=viral metagenome TaxID=1070528 RepID=A0A6M3M4E0_9ZZZZ